MTMGSCTPMIGSAGRRSDIAGFSANCARLNELALARLREGGIDLLMIASRWPAPYPGRDGVVPDAAARTAGRLTPAELEASLDRVLSELRAVPRILLMLPIPELRHDAARCIAMGRTAECAYSRAEFDRAAAASTAMLRRLAATHANVVLVDPSSWFCDTTACRVTRDGASLYFDDDHVSATASAAFGRAYAADPARFEPGAATPGADGGRGTIRP